MPDKDLRDDYRDTYGDSDVKEIIDNLDVKEQVDKKIALLIAEEELRKQRERERAIKLERIKNESFQKRLEKVRAEIEYQEYKKRIKLSEMRMLEVESEKMDIEEKVIDEMRQSAIESLSEKADTSVDHVSFFDNEIDEKIEMKRLQILADLKAKKERINQKEQELTRLVDLADLNSGSSSYDTQNISMSEINHLKLKK